MRFDFPNKIRSGYLAAFILMLLCYFLSLSSFVQLRKQNKFVGHTREVINELGALNANLKDAEVSFHEYILDKQAVYIDAYQQSRDLVDSVYTVLKHSITDNPSQTAKLVAMHSIIDRKYLLLDEELRILKKNNFYIDDYVRVKERQNKLFIDSIANASDSITAGENRLLAQRTQRVISYSQIVFWIIIAAGLISLLLILYSLLAFNMESRAKKNATLQAEAYHVQLEKRILELGTANRELLEFRSLERFTSTGRVARMIAHEIRNPLTNIDLSTGHLENDKLSVEDKKLLLEIISRNSRRINELITELLLATKFSDLKYEPVAVDVLLDEALDDANDRALLNQVSIIKKYSSESILVNVDRLRMKIALLNIIVNALEAMSGNHCQITLETAVVSGQCVITISDNGNGMDQDTRSKIFDPFFTSKKKGNGLGMTNTQNIILNHKGNIEVFSAAGEGTAFKITLNISSRETTVSV